MGPPSLPLGIHHDSCDVVLSKALFFPNLGDSNFTPKAKTPKFLKFGWLRNSQSLGWENVGLRPVPPARLTRRAADIDHRSPPPR